MDPLTCRFMHHSEAVSQHLSNDAVVAMCDTVKGAVVISHVRADRARFP
jgi:hypothetical protein